MKSGSVSVDDSSNVDTDRPFFPGFFFSGVETLLPFDGPVPGTGPLGRRTTVDSLKSGSVSVGDSSSVDTDLSFLAGVVFCESGTLLPSDGPLFRTGPLGRRTTPPTSSTPSASKESAVTSSIAGKKVLANSELRVSTELTVDLFSDILEHGPLDAFPIDLA